MTATSDSAFRLASEIECLGAELHAAQMDAATWRGSFMGLVAREQELMDEVARLRAALERIANLKPMSVLDPNDTQARARRMARRALNA